MAKQSKNLSLDPEAIRRGERYARMHETNVSQLVNNFLSSLPLGGEVPEGEFSPIVRRLYGIAKGSGGIPDYRRHLEEKYGEP